MLPRLLTKSTQYVEFQFSLGKCLRTIGFAEQGMALSSCLQRSDLESLKCCITGSPMIVENDARYPWFKVSGEVQMTVNSRWGQYESDFLVLVAVLPSNLTCCHSDREA